MTTVADAIPLLANVDVDDLTRGVAFYCDAVGLRVGRRLDAIGAVELLGATSPIYVLERPAGSAAAPGSDARRDYRRHWTPVHLEFVVERLEPAVARALAAGARLEGEPTTHAWGRLAVFADPFGNGVCLIEFTDRGYDAVSG